MTSLVARRRISSRHNSALGRYQVTPVKPSEDLSFVRRLDGGPCPRRVGAKVWARSTRSDRRTTSCTRDTSRNGKLEPISRGGGPVGSSEAGRRVDRKIRELPRRASGVYPA